AEAEDSRVVGPDELTPGDTLVVPSEYGGADAFGWDPLSREPVPDVGDLCVNEMANAAPGDGPRLIRLRLHGGLVPGASEDGDSGGQLRPLREGRGLLGRGEAPGPAVALRLPGLPAGPPAGALLAARS